MAFHISLQQVVELEGYVIILVEGRDGKIKLYGSPADRDGLEVADEILDVNERKLDDVPRALVIKHIHEVSWGKGFVIAEVGNVESELRICCEVV